MPAGRDSLRERSSPPLSAIAARDKLVAVGAGLLKVEAEGADERRFWQVDVAINLHRFDAGDDLRDAGSELANNVQPQAAFFFGG